MAGVDLGGVDHGSGQLHRECLCITSAHAKPGELEKILVGKEL